MTINEIFTAYLKMLFECFEYDIAVMSQGWMYYCLLIPILFYCVLFVIKWTLITMPIWLPIRMALYGLSSIVKIVRSK